MGPAHLPLLPGVIPLLSALPLVDDQLGLLLPVGIISRGVQKNHVFEFELAGKLNPFLYSTGSLM